MTERSTGREPLTITSLVPGRAHDVLLVALIALRPLIWSGDAGAWDNLAWLTLTIFALGWLLIDAWSGRFTSWRFGVGGILAAALLVILFPAALRSPFPSTGIGMWGMAIIHLGFAFYIMQTISGRERLAFAALTGALIIECLIALGQWTWVLPNMAYALTHGDASVTGLENANGDLAERIANGGLFGTFTLANTLAAFLLLSAVPLIGVAFASRKNLRLIVGSFIAIALLVAIGTASKGAAVALVLSVVVVWTIHRRGRGRWLALTAFVMLATAVVAMPQLRHLGAASANVRLGYWQGATSLIADAPLSGHGIHAFAALSSRAMPITAEPTRHVHNDVLEIAVDGGIIASVAFALFLLWCARTRRDAHFDVRLGENKEQKTHDAKNEMPNFLRASWPLIIFMLLFTSLGMLASNIGWWPLGSGESTWWLWPLVLSGILIGVIIFCARLPQPPAWAWQLALTAFALHCLVDFNFQSPAIWGTVIVVSALAGGRTYLVSNFVMNRCIVTILIMGMALGLTIGVQRVIELQIGHHFISVAAQPKDGTAFINNSDAKKALTLAEHWPASVELSAAYIVTSPPSTVRLAITKSFAEHYPWNAQAHEWLAQDLATMGQWDDAINALTTAIAYSPAYLPRHQRLAELLDRAAIALPTRANDFQHQAEGERQRIIELAPIVHPRNRLIIKPPSGLSVQPTP
jgi:O-antigen ligase